MESGIYVGSLHHRRMTPVKHEFSYPLFMAFLNIDLLPELMRVSPLASYERWNWISFHEQDHFGDTDLPLRRRVELDAEQQAVEVPRGKIFLLTHLRYLGYNFNPVSFFYCYDHAGACQSILAEVNNTFGETHNYWLTSQHQRAGNVNRYHFDKTFHVSPFMRLRQDYDWTLTTPNDRLVAKCLSFEDEQVKFDATLTLERREWTAAELHRVIRRFPMVTLKVIAAIHWQALRLLLKRVPVVHHPGPGHWTPSNIKHRGASW